MLGLTLSQSHDFDTAANPIPSNINTFHILYITNEVQLQKNK